MATNPNPSRITDPMWRLWEETRDAIGDVQLGGIWASKPGYHNARMNLPGSDYSVQYAADRAGPLDKSAALDITFPEAHGGNYGRIKLVTKRLMEAAKARDPRIYQGSTPVIREVIGNVGGQARNYDLYSRREGGRDDSHLWHIHLSITRKFVGDWSVLSGLVEIMADTTAGGDDMGHLNLKKGDSGDRVEALQIDLDYAGFPVPVDGEYGAKTAAAVLAMRKWMGSTATDGDKMTPYATGQLGRAIARREAIKAAKDMGGGDLPVEFDIVVKGTATATRPV